MGGHEVFPIPGSEGEDDSGDGGRIGPIHGNPESHRRRYKGDSKTERSDKGKVEFPEEISEIYRRVFNLALFIKTYGKKVLFNNEGGEKELYHYDAYPYHFLVYDEEYEEGTVVNIVIDFGDVEYQIVVIPEPNDNWESARIDGASLSILRRRRIGTFNNYMLYETATVEVGLDSGKMETYQTTEFNRYDENMLPLNFFNRGESGDLYPDNQLWSDEDDDLGSLDENSPPSFVIGATGRVYYLLEDIIHILDFLEKGPPPLSKLYSAKKIATKN